MIAYFSAEIGLSDSIPTYSGGLGVLAGDHLKAAADAGLPMVAVTLLYRRGYGVQRLDPEGRQFTVHVPFHPAPLLRLRPERVSVPLRDAAIQLAIYETDIVGFSGHRVPVLFLDADLNENPAWARSLAHVLYGGDLAVRLQQEILLGFGGLAAVRCCFPQVQRFHLNEGHCAFVPLAALRAGLDINAVRRCTHFTTHTPVPAGHDCFPYEFVRDVAGDLLDRGQGPSLNQLAGTARLSMTELALSLSGSANGVSRLHGEVSRAMFPGRDVGHVTNGVHHLTWVAPPMAALYDRHVPEWRAQPHRLLEAASYLPDDALRAAHTDNKRRLLAYANAQSPQGFSENLLTIGFARRAATYKRATLLFRDPERLSRMCAGRVQFIFAGKAHPRDTEGQALIHQVFALQAQVSDRLRVAYLPNHSMWLGGLITAGVDLWLNTPRRPHEASGTSGMKAALNGVPHASISDGWWAEGAEHGRNGWTFGHGDDDAADAEALYQLLERDILPAYSGPSWANLMRGAIATGARFTAARMLAEYQQRYYGVN